MTIAGPMPLLRWTYCLKWNTGCARKAVLYLAALHRMSSSERKAVLASESSFLGEKQE